MQSAAVQRIRNAVLAERLLREYLETGFAQPLPLADSDLEFFLEYGYLPTEDVKVAIADAELVGAEDSGGYTFGPFPLYVFDPAIQYMVPAEKPTRAALRIPPNTRGLARGQYREKGSAEWLPFRPPDQGVGRFGFVTREQFYVWFYSEWSIAMGRYTSVEEVRFQYTRAPSKALADLPHLFAAETGNCAINLLIRHTKSDKYKKALKKIKIPQSGFGPDQLKEAFAAMGWTRPIRIVDRTGRVMCSVGDQNYRGVIDIVDYNSHALDSYVCFPELGDEVPVRVVDDEKLGDFCHLQNTYGRRTQLWPVPNGVVVPTQGGYEIIRNRRAYAEIEARAKELNLSEKDYRLACSPFGVECLAWRREHGFGVTKGKTVDLWKAANFFPVTYATGAKKARVADMNRAYETSPLLSDYWEQYGMPADGGIAMKNPPMDCLEKTGMAVARLRAIHPWVKYITAGQERGCYTTMRLKCWLDHKAIEILEIELVVLTKAYWPTLERPNGARWCCPTAKTPDIGEEREGYKGWGREAIGRLIPSATRNPKKYYITEEAEFVSVQHSLDEKGLLVDAIECGRGDQRYWVVLYKDDRDSGAYHTHAYFLDYTATRLEKEIFSRSWSTIAKVKVDSIAVTDNSPLPVEGWKDETGKYSPTLYPPPQEREVPDLPEAGTYWEALAENRAVLVEAPAGFGKSYMVEEKLRDHLYMAVTPTRKMAKTLIEKGIKAYTWKYLLKPADKFDPRLTRMTATHLIPDVVTIHICEIGTWGAHDVATIVPWLLMRGYRVVADGDRHQLPPISGERPWGYIDENFVRDPYVGRDYRSEEPGLAVFKEGLRGKNNQEVVAMALKEGLGCDYRELIENWHPRDYVYSTRRSDEESSVYMPKAVLKALQDIHKCKYPQEPVRIQYTSKDKERSGEEDFIRLDQEMPKNARPTCVSTVHISQGDTVSPPARVWFLDAYLEGESFDNGAYVALTRVQRRGQLSVVTTGLPGIEARQITQASSKITGAGASERYELDDLYS